MARDRGTHSINDLQCADLSFRLPTQTHWLSLETDQDLLGAPSMIEVTTGDP